MATSLKIDHHPLVADVKSLVLIRRELVLRRSRENLYTFCRVLSPDFFRPDRPHLRVLAETLQVFYENKLLDGSGVPYRKLMINLPPRFGKTRTLVLFCAWAFGKNIEERIIATSYGDDIANDFSRYTRYTIQEQKNQAEDIVYSDIFP